MLLQETDREFWEKGVFSLRPQGLGPVRAQDFEHWTQDELRPLELIGGWVLPMSPGTIETGDAWGALYAVLLPHMKRRNWRLALDARHHLPLPSETIVFPDIALHATDAPERSAPSGTVTRVPELVIEVLSDGTASRDLGPHGAKYLAYQASGVREYYVVWPDGGGAEGWELIEGKYRSLVRDADGYFKSPLLGAELRLVPADLRDPIGA